MTISNPYKDMLEAPRAPIMSVVSKALAAFSKTGIDPSEDAIDPARAKTLLKKVLGEDVEFVEIKTEEPFDPAIDNPVFVIDNIELKFQQGTNPEEDVFNATFAGVPSDQTVRTLEGLGAAMTNSISPGQLAFKGLTKEEMESYAHALLDEDEDDLYDDEDELEDED